MKFALWLIWATILLRAGAASSAERFEEGGMRLNIPPESLNEALFDVAAQLNVSIFWNPRDLPQGLHSSVIAGVFTPSEALTLLLGQTALRFEYFKNDRHDSFGIFPSECSKNFGGLKPRISVTP